MENPAALIGWVTQATQQPNLMMIIAMKRLLLFTLAWLLLLTFNPAVSQSNIPPRRPNLVVMLADDTGKGDVEFFNPTKGLARTPNLNAMATSPSAIVFNNMHSEAACTPSRIALLTSRTPIRDCVWKQTNPPFRKDLPSIVEIARKSGYRTLHLGKFPQGSDAMNPDGWPTNVGFENWTIINHGVTYDFPCMCRLGEVSEKEKCFLGHYGDQLTSDDDEGYPCLARQSPDFRPYTPPRFMMESVHLAHVFDEWLETVDPNANFVAQIAFRSVHKPFIASPELRLRCASGEICRKPMKRELSSTELDYAGCLYAIDQAVGLIRASVRKRRLKDWTDTILVFLSDNGPEAEALGGVGSTLGMNGRKRSLFEGLLNTPAILEWPAVVKANRVSDAFVSIMDIPATFLDAMHRTTNDHRQSETSWAVVKRDGMSLLSLLVDRDDASFQRKSEWGICSDTTEVQFDDNFICANLVIYNTKGKWKLF